MYNGIINIYYNRTEAAFGVFGNSMNECQLDRSGLTELELETPAYLLDIVILQEARQRCGHLKIHRK